MPWLFTKGILATLLLHDVEIDPEKFVKLLKPPKLLNDLFEYRFPEKNSPLETKNDGFSFDTLYVLGIFGEILSPVPSSKHLRPS